VPQQVFAVGANKFSATTQGGGGLGGVRDGSGRALLA
jgi:hypothetical protein